MRPPPPAGHGPRWLALLAAGLIAPDLAAQTAPIATDRPSVSYGVTTLSPGRFQLETGLELQRQDGVTTVSAPFAALRAGLAERLELLVFVPSWSRRSSTGGSESGFGDLAIGARRGFSAGGVGLATLVLATLPTGAEGFSGPTAVRAGLAAEAAAGDATVFATGLLALQDRGDRLAPDLELSAGLGRSIADRTSGFVEGYLQARARARDGGGARLGLTRLLRDDLQLDLYGGIDVVSPSTPVAGAGFSIRW